MGRFVGGTHDLILEGDNLVAFHGRAGVVRLLTAEQVRQRLGYAHLRHIYWLVQQGYLPFRKFGRELVFAAQDVEKFLAEREGRMRATARWPL